MGKQVHNDNDWHGDVYSSDANAGIMKKVVRTWRRTPHSALGLIECQRA